MIGNGLRQEYAQYYTDVLGVEGGQIDEVSFCRLPTQSRAGGWIPRNSDTVFAWS